MAWKEQLRNFAFPKKVPDTETGLRNGSDRNGQVSEPSQEGHAKNITDDPLYALKSRHLIRRGKSRINVLFQRHEALAIRGEMPRFQTAKFEGPGPLQAEPLEKNMRKTMREKSTKITSCQVATNQGEGHQHHHRQKIRESYRQI
jgi:hypothetical protein